MEHLNKSAALHDWLQQQGSALAWPKADQVALYCVAVVLAFMLSAYALPESEATVYLRTQVALWGNLALLAIVSLSAIGIIAPTVGRLLGIGAAEFVASWKETRAELAAGETRQAIEAETGEAETGEAGNWTFPNGMSPYLSPSDRLRISQATDPKLNDTTGERVKAGIANGMTAAQVAAETGLSDTLVRRYAAIFRRGENLSQPIPLSWESE